MIAFEELNDSPKESWGPEGKRATRRVLVEYSEREDFIKEVFGASFVFGKVAGVNYPDTPSTYVVKAKSEPFHDALLEDLGPFTDIETEINSYRSKALITLEYEFVAAEGREIEEIGGTDANGYLTYRMHLGADAEVIPCRGLIWYDSGDPVAEHDVYFTKRVPTSDHALSWHRVTSPPLDAVRSARGKLNSAPFLGAPRGCVLFEGAEVEAEYSIPGLFNDPKQLYKVNYTFKERNIGDLEDSWQKIWRSLPPENSGWTTIATNGGEHLYEYSDFSELFQQQPGVVVMDLGEIT